MVKRRIPKLCPGLVAIVFASTALLFPVQPASASSALFRAKRTWWFSQAGSWTDGYVIPPAGTGKNPYEPPAVAYVGDTYPVRGFTAPKSFIKDTTYYFTCGPGTFYCPWSYPRSSGWYSYWNAKGSFRANNPNAPNTTTTVRMRTTADGYDASLMGWPTVMRTWSSRKFTVATPPPTAMGDPLTPTTTWGGRYDHSRGGSIMIWPGKNRFGGTMRFFEGPNHRYHAYLRGGPGYSYTYTITFRAKPLDRKSVV